MLSMRLGAGLVLSAAASAGAVPAAADANTYCAGEVPSFYACTATSPTIQGALDAAGSNPGYDLVRIVDGRHVLTGGLVYSDHGQSDNEVWIGTGARCPKTGCPPLTLAGGASGETLLSFGGGGGANVVVEGLIFEPHAGVTALMLPPGGRTSVTVRGEDGSIGIRPEGTPERPAIISGVITQPIGGATDIAIDAAGAARTVSFGYITSDIAARSRMSEGWLDVHGVQIHARIGVTGQRARITRSLVDLRDGPGPSLGFEAVCPDAGAADAEISATNVTVLASGTPDTTGARAIARGGDGDACDATVRLNSTILYGFATSLDGVGENGSGADPRDGTARFEMAYSNFDPGAVSQSGPTHVETASPGGNVYGDPRFNPRAPAAFGLGPGLAWNSPLVDRGDPAPLEDSEPWPFQSFVNGRRDIGVREYLRDDPSVTIAADPWLAIRPGRTVRLGAGATDMDGEPLNVKWEFSDGTTSEYEEVGDIPIPSFMRRYPRPGSYVERVTATDPTGLRGSAETVVVVRRQRMLRLSIVPRRLRTPRVETGRSRSVIRFRTTILDETVYFRVERGVLRRGSPGIRWVRTRHRFEAPNHARPGERPFNGWIDGRRLRPGRYRLVAAPRGVRPLRARFRILR